jgi:hypothetical protein
MDGVLETVHRNLAERCRERILQLARQHRQAHRRVAFRGDEFANVPGLIDYVARLKGTARLRPDQRLSITRDWGSAAAKLNGALQLSKGLAKLARA